MALWSSHHSFLPIHTSPNCPAPSFFSIWRDSRGISQASFSHGFWGLGDTHGTDSFWQSPSFPSETKCPVSRWYIPQRAEQDEMLPVSPPPPVFNKPNPQDRPTWLVRRPRSASMLHAESHVTGILRDKPFSVGDDAIQNLPRRHQTGSFFRTKQPL